MKNIIILAIIVIYWFLLGSFLTVIASDDALGELQTQSINENYSIGNISGFNFSTTSEGNPSSSEIGEFFKRMLSLRTPTSGVPQGLQAIIAFSNYLLIGVCLVMLYKLASPLTDS